MFVPVSQFAPDADNTTPGLLVSVTSMVPTLKGYKAAPTAVDVGLDALASDCYGAVTVRKLDNTPRFIAGTATKLYEASGSTWSDVSGSAYNATAEQRWDFAQFGNVTLAANKGDTLQFSETGAFADIAGAPKAALVETVNQFVIVANTNDVGFGDSPDRWWCCAIGDYTDWTPDTATQCVSGRLTSAPGHIAAFKRLGDGIVAYKDRAMFIGSYVGAPEVWSFQEIPGDVGCASPLGVVNIGAAHIFVSHDNFYIYDGSRPTPIGNPIKEYFFANLYPDFAYRIRSVHDRNNSNVYFYYPSRSGAGALDSCVVYNYRVNKWGVDDRDIQESVDYVAPGLTFDSTFATTFTFATVDPTLAFISAILIAGQPAPVFIGTDKKAYALTGNGNTWALTTNDVGSDTDYTTVTRVTPRFLTKPTTSSMTHYHREVIGDSLTTGDTVSLSSGRYDIIKSDKWHRFALSGTGGVEISGLEVFGVEGGSE